MHHDHIKYADRKDKVTLLAYLSAEIGSSELGSCIGPINHFSPIMDIIALARINAWNFSAGAAIKWQEN